MATMEEIASELPTTPLTDDGMQVKEELKQNMARRWEISSISHTFKTTKQAPYRPTIISHKTTIMTNVKSKLKAKHSSKIIQSNQSPGPSKEIKPEIEGLFETDEEEISFYMHALLPYGTE
ncbi:hypothetical protein CHS0354_004825 [Potamilus streckersoni]|uniref:Uncharacterized protein n=1 Tax=Potamilus streckersoni TaxID=2493646 RepID=A0AAE0S9D9_9BIVA|nr:hypothetical protein CHS0354_004825 [Potamilus streckersoni]